MTSSIKFHYLIFKFKYVFPIFFFRGNHEQPMTGVTELELKSTNSPRVCDVEVIRLWDEIYLHDKLLLPSILLRHKYVRQTSNSEVFSSFSYRGNHQQPMTHGTKLELKSTKSPRVWDVEVVILWDELYLCDKLLYLQLYYEIYLCTSLIYVWQTYLSWDKQW